MADRSSRSNRRRARPRRTPTAGPAVPVPGAIHPSYVPPDTSAHAICRVCGRILRVRIAPEEVATLQAFSDRRPDGWSVEGMSFSFTGICPQCRPGHPP